MSTFFPELSDIRDTFHQAVMNQEGEVAECLESDNSLFIRARLAADDCARPGDIMNPGVALRCRETQIEVCPYVYRQVCRNGAILARSTGAAEFCRNEWQHELSDQVLQQISDAVAACTSEESRADYFDQIRESALAPASMDLLLTIMPLVPGLLEQSPGLLSTILGEFDMANDRTGFGLMNAITSTARDTHDPETKWELEKLGGLVPAHQSSCEFSTPGLNEDVSVRPLW